MRIPFKSRGEKFRFYTLTAVAITFVLVGFPLAASIATQYTIISLGKQKVADIAKDVLARSDRLSGQLRKAIDQLEAHRGTDPCSQDNIDRMRDAALNSTDVIIVGFAHDNTLLCSSYGQHPGGIPLGEIDFTGTYNSRRSVRLRTASHATFFAVEKNGWTFFFSKTLPIDIPLRSNVSLATYTTNVQQIRNTHGFIRPEWMVAGRKGQEITFTDDGYVVAVIESNEYASGAIAAIPVSELRQGQSAIETITQATSTIAGASIAGWIVYFARKNLSLSSFTLHRALKNDEFYLVYQPIVDLRTQHWVGAEVLMRWRRGEAEIPPDIFIAAAEELGIVELFTQKVLDLVSRDASALFGLSQSFYLSINLTAADVKSSDIVDRLKALLARTGASPSRFKVEVTERSVLDTNEAQAAIAEIKALGIDTVIDDFGTGFSNLKYLTTFKFDYLKIDRAFVQGIGTGALSGKVAFHIIAIAQSLGMGIIAEGVEKETQAEALMQQGVALAQGWLFAHPKTAADLMDSLQSKTA